MLHIFDGRSGALEVFGVGGLLSLAQLLSQAGQLLCGVAGTV